MACDIEVQVQFFFTTSCGESFLGSFLQGCYLPNRFLCCTVAGSILSQEQKFALFLDELCEVSAVLVPEFIKIPVY